jgi:cytochrome c oxidase subunit 3
MGHAEGSYYLPEPSQWPIVGSVGLFVLVAGIAHALHGGTMLFMFAGAALLVYMLFGWFGQVIDENLAGKYNARVDTSFRIGMGWFIFSEVMFFAAFFGALFYVRAFAVPWLGGEGVKLATHELLWPGFEAAWPTNGPGAVGGHFEPMGAWGIPALNTLILLSSGVTITWAHWGLKRENRGQLVWGLAATVGLGALFLVLQAYEYIHAYTEMNLTLGSGIYGSTFFMLTGFHGMHVTIGAIMLAVMLARSVRGHFTPDNHFAFEAAAWYWHFVDVVWLLLFVMVYWLI